MADAKSDKAPPPPPEEIVLYEKDPATRIAIITLNRPGFLNAPTIAARQRYADLVHRANVDDDVRHVARSCWCGGPV